MQARSLARLTNKTLRTNVTRIMHAQNHYYIKQTGCTNKQIT